MNHDRGPDRPVVSGWGLAVAAILLFVAALLPRLLSLSELGFYADEDLTAHVATAMARGNASDLPSGFQYRRALPYTAVTALFVRLFGSEDGARDAFALRLPSALFGALTVPVFFLMLARCLGGGPALVGALLLAFSEWHLVFSRLARMYSPTVFFLVVATWGLWSWVRSGRAASLVAGAVASLTAMSLHVLAIVCVAVPVVWLAFPSGVAVPAWVALLVAAGLAALGLGFDVWVANPYSAFATPPPLGDATRAGAAISTAPDALLAVAGALIAGLLFWRVRPVLARHEAGGLRMFGLGVLALLAGALAGLGQVYGFALFWALFLLAAGTGIASLWRGGWIPLLALGSLLSVRLLVRVSQAGLSAGLRASASWPYPHAYTLFQQEPALCLLFGATVTAVAVRRGTDGDRGVAVFAMLALGTLAAIGFARAGGPTRYLLPAYPWFLAVAGAGLFEGVRRVVDWISTEGRVHRRAYLSTTLVAALIAVSGVVSGHGVPQAARIVSLRHGEPVDELAHMFPFRPDHRSPGSFVRERRGEGDIVIAEDPIVQTLYAGHIDYWFRRYGDMRRYLREYPDGVRDLYVGSRPLADPAIIDSLARDAPARVWLITSGETAPLRRWYLSPEQRSWLDSLERAREPAWLGEDGVSAAYCLNCPGPDGGASAGGSHARPGSNR